MPKKRFTSQFSKPQSTVHPSLSSPTTAGGSSSNHNDVPPTVNELITSLRKTSTSLSSKAAPSPTPTLPPQIRHLLAQPETPSPAPRLRSRRLVDSNGRRVPAGPPPPRSWLESRHAAGGLKARSGGQERIYPTDLHHLPGLQVSSGRRLQDMCLRQMAKDWEFIRDYERNNLADLPTALRMELLSYIAVGGPDDGIGFEGLRDILVPRKMELSSGAEENGSRDVEAQDSNMINQLAHSFEESSRYHGKKGIDSQIPLEEWDDDQSNIDFDPCEHNDNLYRLDLSGSLGHSISFKQLTSILERPVLSMSASVPHLTHLSLSYPTQSTSWRSLLALSKHVPTLTHLCLAYWPTPTLTANAQAAVMSSQFGRDVQYGGTNYYSHSLDNDFREAADVLRRLAGRLYGLEYLDLSGCQKWIRALRWTGEDHLQTGSNDLGIDLGGQKRIDGIDWRSQFLKLSTLKVNGLTVLNESSDLMTINHFVQAIKEARATERMLAWWTRKGKRKGKWVEVRSDDYKKYEGYWRGKDVEDRRKRMALDVLDWKDVVGDDLDWRGPEIFDEGEGIGPEGQGEVEIDVDESLQGQGRH